MRKLLICCTFLLISTNQLCWAEEIDWQKKYLETQLQLEVVSIQLSHAVADNRYYEAIINQIRKNEITNATKQTKDILAEYNKSKNGKEVK